MGHIDHGKSTLLDYIREASVTAKEAGGITQHVGAYETEVDHEGKKRKITFLDTPGHEAFSKMRARGAKTADIAILVVAADDGVQPQTMEAYQTIAEAKLPFVIAMNKIDKPDAEPERLKAQLAEKGIYVEGYGGNIPYAAISAKTGKGVPELLDTVLILADMADLKADPDQNASGVVVESNLDPRRGIASTLLIQNGTLEKGMYLLAGMALAPVRIFEDFTGKAIEKATFSSPVRITGFSAIPSAGEEFKTFKTKKEAEEALIKAKEMSDKKTRTEKIIKAAEEENKVAISLIIKTDTAGSVEALEKEMMKLQDAETILTVLRGGVGKVNEDDARFASASKNSIILGFNVATDSAAKEIIERSATPFFTSDIIYKISDWLKGEISKRKAEIPREEIIGVAKILKTFSRQKNKQVIGGKVTSGKMAEGKTFKIKRRDVEIGEGKITNLQQSKKEVKEVETGSEFGAMTENRIEIAKEDEIVIVGR
ncbi:translation initiation factor IF-2 [Candidatus Parcubacteria bacterium]|nr:MAG: translation initiation factor IF-2 [Candidatus Parcubacteria bacterium]